MTPIRFFHTILLGGLVLFLVFPRALEAQGTIGNSGVEGAPAAQDQPITGSERIKWAVHSTIGPKSPTVGVFSAGWRTALNNPEEYGPHWGGFAKRYGVRMAGISTGNAIEAGVGTLWNEDPRYIHSVDRGIKPRLKHAAAMVVFASRGDGHRAPAYARYAGVVGNNFISNTWRAESENGVGAAFARSALGFLGKFASNVVEEFWQDLSEKVRKQP